MHSYATTNRIPPHLHPPLGQERREAAVKCVQALMPDLSYSQGRDCKISHLPFPLPPTFICYHSIQERTSILKMSPSLWWKNTACVLGNRLRKDWIKQPEHQHPPHDWADPGLSFARQPQGNMLCWDASVLGTERYMKEFHQLPPWNTCFWKYPRACETS